MVRATWAAALLTSWAGFGCAIDWTVPKKPPANDGGAGGADSEAGAGKASSSSASSTAAAGGKTACDGTGDCQTCIGCAEGAACAAVVKECLSINDCMSVYKCAEGCFSETAPDCLDTCEKQFPSGAKDFAPVIHCLLCAECPSDCVAAKRNCP